MFTGWDIAHPAACGPGALGRGPIVVQAFPACTCSPEGLHHKRSGNHRNAPRLYPASDRGIAKAPHLSHGLPSIAPPTPRRTRTSGPPVAPAACDTPWPRHRLSHPIAAASTHPELAAISTLRHWLRSSLRSLPSRSSGGLRSCFAPSAASAAPGRDKAERRRDAPPRISVAPSRAIWIMINM